MTTKDELKDVKKRIRIAIDSLGNEHHLSTWERGQQDGLYWAMQIVQEMIDPSKLAIEDEIKKPARRGNT